MNIPLTVVDGIPESQSEASMTVSGSSREDVTGMNKEYLNTAKQKLNIGFWNVRTMFDTGKLAQVVSEMKRYNLDILGVSESRWTGSGKFTTATGELVFYSGREDGKHQEGVALFLKKNIAKCVLEWKPTNNRIIKIRLKGRQANFSILQCYAPTNDSEDEEKNNFYEQLQNEMRSIPNHDLTIVLGDLNAKVGSDNAFYNREMGRHGCGVMNDNGERLLDFCACNNLVVGGTIFEHKDIHKITWCSPNNRDRNQIDHLMISGKWRRSLQDVMVKRGADVGSDHYLVVAKVKLKLEKYSTNPNQNKRYDIDKLKDPKIKTV